MGELLGHDAPGSYTGLWTTQGLTWGQIRDICPNKEMDWTCFTSTISLPFPHRIHIYFNIFLAIQPNETNQAAVGLSVFPQQNTTMHEIKFIAWTLCSARRQPQIQVSLLAVIKASPVTIQDRPTVVPQRPTQGGEQKWAARCLSLRSRQVTVLGHLGGF